jgi:hypothetical protein
MEQRMQETIRHNKKVEAMEQQRFQLKENRLNLEQKIFQSLEWKGKNDELNYKMNLIARYEEFKLKHNWSDDQILAFYPDMAQVINAKKRWPSSPELPTPVLPTLPPLPHQLNDEEEEAVGHDEEEAVGHSQPGKDQTQSGDPLTFPYSF